MASPKLRLRHCFSLALLGAMAVGGSPESRVKVRGGTAPHKLIEHGWSNFLVKVHNEAGVTAPEKADPTIAKRRMQDSEKQEARAAYDEAAAYYKKVLEETSEK